MADSTNKGLAEPASGTTNWDTILNSNFSIIDSALGGGVTVALAALTTYTLVTAEWQALRVDFTGTANCVVTIPNNAAGDPVAGQWLMTNLGTGTVSVQNIETPGTYAVIPSLCRAWVVSDGLTAYIVQTPVFLAYDDGTKSSGSFMPKFSAGVFQYLTNNGAFTLQAPTITGSYEMFILVTNGASAGVITMTGFTGISGPAMTTTNANKYLIRITRVNTTVTAEIVSLQQTASSYTSSQQTITPSGTLTLPHGLQAEPSIISLKLVCVTADIGYSPGDVVLVETNMTSDGYNRFNGVQVDATNVVVSFATTGGAGCFVLTNKSTNAAAAITNSRWKLVVGAYVL